MGIGSITSTGSMSSMQITATDLKDQKSKSIQKEITDVQQQMQKLSSEGELSATEKENEKKELKREKTSLDTELKQHQEELLRSHKREIKLAELQEARKPEQEENGEKPEGRTQPAESASNEKEEKKLPVDERQAAQPGTVITQSSDGTVILKEIINQAENAAADTENSPADEAKEAAPAQEETEPTDDDPAADTRPSVKEIQAMVSADASMQLADRLGTIVTKTNDGIAILKGEMKQDAYRGTDTERKQAELEKMQKQQQQEMAFQFSLLGEAANAMQSATDTNASVKVDAERTFHVSGLQVTPDEQAAQQGFQVAIA
ncbi:MAG: hypothetical protein K2K90_02935 [Lachnospiraceae bacterium]|nr:hypothetical protein [Lachnospiraceae bacterium]